MNDATLEHDKLGTHDTPDILSALNHEAGPEESRPILEAGACPFTSGALKQTAGGGTRNRDSPTGAAARGTARSASRR